MRKIELPGKEIAEKYMQNSTHKQLAEEYNVSMRTIVRALRENIDAEEYEKVVKRNIEIRSELRKNIPRTEETKRKISQANKGKKYPEQGERQRGGKNHMYGRTGSKHHNYGKNHTLETRILISEKLKGKVPWNKKTNNERNLMQKIRDSFEYNEWRNNIFKRDKYTCQMCGKVGGKLEAHHVRRVSRYPQRAFDIENGVTLCQICHKNIKVGRRIKIEYLAKDLMMGSNEVIFTANLEGALKLFEAYDTGKSFKVTISDE